MNSLAKTLGLSFAALLCVLSTNVQAGPFAYPPEVYWSGWVTSSPYQRNINMDFGVTPVGSPGSGIPGAVYAGSLDSSLKASDYAEFDGDMAWYASVPGITQTGLIGIDNRNGTSTLSGYLVFHLGNTSNAAKVEHVWEEFDWLTNQGDFGWGVFDTSGIFDLTRTFEDDLAGGVSRLDSGWARSPNPTSESVVFELHINPGNYFLFDNLHVATECVPEPGTVALLGVGLISLLAYAWRRRK